LQNSITSSRKLQEKIREKKDKLWINTNGRSFWPVVYIIKQARENQEEQKSISAFWQPTKAALIISKIYHRWKADTNVNNRIVFIVDKTVAQQVDDTMDLIKKTFLHIFILNSKWTDKYLFFKVWNKACARSLSSIVAKVRLKWFL
jgi:hypothetical protein